MKASLGAILLPHLLFTCSGIDYTKTFHKIFGKRLASLLCFFISRKASDCPLCSTFFCDAFIDAGESPESLALTTG